RRRKGADGIGSHLSCDHLPQKERTTHGYQSSGDPQQLLSPRPSVDRPDTDPQRVQAPSRNDEAHAIKQRALSGRKFGSVRVSMKYGEEANEGRGNPQRRADFEHYSSTEQNC